MHAFSQTQLNVLIPIVIIILSLIIKVAFNNNFSLVGIGDELVKFPADVSLLAVSFMCTFMITSKDNIKSAVLYLLLIFIASIITYGVTKKASDYYSRSSKTTKIILQTVGLIFLSYFFSIPTLIVSIILLVKGIV